MSNLDRQRGFTLVELAIVLVIIGLLLGGILKGQELINSARVRSLADLNASVQAAYYGFIDRYRQVPGDMKAGSAGPNDACNALGTTALPNCATVGGDGNGRLDPNPGWPEASAVWAHLSASGFLAGGYQGGATSEPTYSRVTVAPVNAFNGRLLLSRSADYEDPKTPPLRLNLVIGDGVPVSIMRELDVKVDDGLPQSGILRAAPNPAAGFGGIVAQSTDTNCVKAGNPAIWDVTTNTRLCNGVFLY